MVFAYSKLLGCKRKSQYVHKNWRRHSFSWKKSSDAANYKEEGADRWKKI